MNSKDNYTPLNALNPPSIGSNAPVTKLAASLHRNCTAPFSSLISPKRFIGVLAKTFLLRSVSEPSGLISTARFWSPMKKPGPGAKNPPQLGKLCHGVNLSNMSDEEIWKRGIDLSYVIDAYRNLNMDDHFFRSFFELLIGTDYVRKMIKEGKSAEEIKARWKDDVEKFKVQRKPYLLYEE